jgi:hypothetical protein
MPILWRPWGDPLLDSAPADVANCQAGSRCLARQRGATVTEDEEGALMLLAPFCELPVALQEGLEESPELD